MLFSFRRHSAALFFVLAVAAVLFGLLTFKVNTVKSEVLQAERRIIALRNEKILLETEFQTRANQQQLANWNEVDFGYRAPGPGQFLENERQLARLGLPRAAGAPEPIRVASAVTETPGQGLFPQMVSPLTGQAFAAESADAHDGPPLTAGNLSQHLAGGAPRISLSAGSGASQ